MSLNILLETA